MLLADLSAMSPVYFLNTYFILPELFSMHPVHSQILYEGRYSAALLAGCVDAQLSADLASSRQPSSPPIQKWRWGDKSDLE